MIHDTDSRLMILVRSIVIGPNATLSPISASVLPIDKKQGTFMALSCI